MASLSVNYPSPVTVNGFSCRNCTEVDYAKRNIDPAHPKAGPFGMNDPKAALESANVVEKRKAELAADRQNPYAYQASGAMAGSNAIGAMVDRSA